MSIINAFDPISEEIISPREAVEKIDDFPETVIAGFSRKFEELFIKSFAPEQISTMVAGVVVPVYRFSYRGKTLAYYHTLLGGPASAALLEEIIAKGGKKILFFGSCGSLDKSVTVGNIILPTEAYRDEGTSYHYVPAGDFIEIKTAHRLAGIFDELGLSYRKVRTWTTDSFYRETRANLEDRRSRGCSVVEMECASVMAVGQFRGVEVSQFLYTTDCLDGQTWDTGMLGKMPDDFRQRILTIALETAIRL